MWIGKKFREVVFNVIGLVCAPFVCLFEKLKFKYNLHRLFRKEDKMYDVYDKLVKQAKSSEEKEQLRSEEGAEFFAIRDEIDMLITGYLRNEAVELFVPLPKFNDTTIWKERYPNSSQHVLTDEGVARIRTLIRREKKEKREGITTLLTILIGLIGAISGLMAIIMAIIKS
jgi:hypothetical protein